MQKAKWENWVNVLLGVWTFITPWIMNSKLLTDMEKMMHWNSWLVGATLVISAGTAIQNLQPWEERANLALGLWLILSPWIMGYSHEPILLWNSIVVGAVVVSMSALALPEAQKFRRQR